MFSVLACIAEQHDPLLLTLSILICLLGCSGTVTALARAEVAPVRGDRIWLFAAAAIFGGSVWSLHFVAMLAFHPEFSIAYDARMTMGSILVIVLGALIAFLLRHLARDHSIGTAGVGILLGLSVAAMHYLGVDAIHMSGLIIYDQTAILVSLILSAGLAGIALVRASSLKTFGRRLEVAFWLVLAISSIHFTGMSAITIAPGPAPQGSDYLIGRSHLGLMVGISSLAILGATLIAQIMYQRIVRQMADEYDRMRLLSDLAHEVLFIHRDDCVLVINRAGTRLFDRSEKKLIGMPVVALFSEADVPALLRRNHIGPDERHPEEFNVCTAAGLLIPVEFSCQPIEYLGLPATAVVLRDLSDRKRDEARIRHLALHDALTNLPNRLLLEERLTLALETAAHDGTEVAIVYLDLDRFKPVNDLNGHAIGDALLKRAAKRMQALLRANDTLARIGGDEFVIVLVQRTPGQVADLIARVIADLSQAFRIEEHTIEIGASAGIALYPGDGKTTEGLLRAADTALYRVKDESRGALRFFEASMDAQLQARRLLERELGQAIARDELQLFYQPIVNARTGEIETFEALIRWHHPQHGTVSPALFIPVAEQAGLIARIGQWVIETACAEAARWPQPWRVSVNVSPSQFRQSDVPAIVAAALMCNDLSPNRLVIEITESVFIQDADNAVAVLSKLRAQGVRLALDDFGTGYSSLSYLQKFKFDKIKIDQSFVRRLGHEEDTLTIVRAIVNLAHNLGMQVTVEGVETVEQQAVVSALGCEQMQGYLFGRPAPSAILTDLEYARLRARFIAPHLKFKGY